MEVSAVGQARRALGGQAQPLEKRLRLGSKLSTAAFTLRPEGLKGGWGEEGDPGSDRTINTLEIRAPGTPLPPLPSRWNPPEPRAPAGRAPQGREGARGGIPTLKPVLLTL